MTQKLFSLSAIILLLSTSLFSQTALEEYDPVENGAIQVPFSVSETKKVYFSISNLQYQPSTGTWRFTPNQFDVVGTDNEKVSKKYTGWIDLFGWATSGYNKCYPYLTDCSMYLKGLIVLPNRRIIINPFVLRSKHNYAKTYGDYNKFITRTNYDWGFYNPIDNGGNQQNQWRTLTMQEWGYLFVTRPTTSGARYAKAQVSGVNGIILLPDDWSFSCYSLINTNQSGASFSSNLISDIEWHNIEDQGAVFLPAAGYRDEFSITSIGSSCMYWSASFKDSARAYFMLCDVSLLSPQNYCYRCDGCSVRLVKDYNP